MTGPCGLAIEAATDEFGLAACRRGAEAAWSARPARGETQNVYAHAMRLLAELGASLQDLDFVAFGCGPGSFTGVRVAAAATQAIAFARGIPVCRISTLAVLAAGARGRSAERLVATCLDARMGQAYVALYRVAGAGVPVAQVRDALIDPGRFTLPGDEAFVAAGDGWSAYPALLSRHGSRVAALEADLLPSARDLLSMATGEFASGRTVSAEQALPEYLGQVPPLGAQNRR